ncbi:putative transposase [Roseinatronobacter thiooxidans]|uniref:Putative transposase n=1 Tax=Roseinatronobacter thiooxidans TaxID=121821 RepID=A0A2W7R512_9RHOB|nr:IS200/IS605 family transposase [Roseinatronobacter thiooxidans]PZX45735.1 putative transposase [Roseinatronobacter thiooxidans]
MEYRKGRHVVSALHVHLVFVTRYRRGALDDDALSRLRDTFAAASADFGARLVECDGEADHVHLLLEYPPTVTLARLVNSLKGVGSRLLLRDRPELRRFAQKGLWSPSYFAASCGGAPIEIVRKYVANQRSAT